MKYIVLSKSGTVVKVYDCEVMSDKVVTITDEEYKEKVLSVPDFHKTRWKNGDFYHHFIPALKRESMSEERDSYIQTIKPVMENVWYQEKLNLTSEQLEDLKELYFRLLDAPQHYDVSDNQVEWTFNWVDEYTSGKNTDNYQLKRLDFIKW